MPALTNATVSPQAEAAPPQVPSPFADVVAGTIPAVTVNPITGGKTDPAQDFAVKHLPELLDAGLDYHETPSQHTVFFNPSKVSAKDLDAADKVGKLAELAPVAQNLAPIGAPAAQEPAQVESAPVQAPLAAPTPSGPLSGASVSGGDVPGLNAARLKNVAPPAKMAPNPVPGALAKRAI